MMVFLGKYLGIGPADTKPESFALEPKLLAHLRRHKVLLQMGGPSHFPFAGWYRLTFSRGAAYMDAGLARLDKALGSWPGPPVGS